MVAEYRTRPDGFAAVRRGILRRFGLVAVPVLAAGAAFTVERGPDVPVEIVLVLAAVLAVAGLTSVRTALGTARRVWDSYTLVLEDDGVTRRQEGVADLFIARDDVTAIQELPQGGLVLRSADPMRFILVPDGLDGYEAVKSRLGRWREVEAPESWKRTWRRNVAFQWVATLLSVGAFVVLLVSMDPWVVVPLGTAVLGLVIWAGIATWSNPQLYSRAQRGRFAWFYVGALVVFKMALVVFWPVP